MMDCDEPNLEIIADYFADRTVGNRAYNQPELQLMRFRAMSETNLQDAK
jgi:hypothetical protein